MGDATAPAVLAALNYIITYTEPRKPGTGLGPGIATGSNDFTAQLWNQFTAGQELFEEAKRLLPRCLTAAQRLRYHLATASPKWCDAQLKWH